MKALFLLAALLLPFLSGGCLTSTCGQDRLCEGARPFATRDQILQGLGGPCAVRNEACGGQTLIYQATRQQGGGLGAGFSVFKLLVLSQGRRSDKVTFTVGADGCVTNRTVELETDKLGYAFWPF